MLIGYNTNGFGFHRLDDAVDVMAELGYRCVALTLDVHHLDPFRSTAQDIASLRTRLKRHGMACVIETGARFLLDSRRKHRPTLLDTDAAQRVEFLERAMQVATELGALCVSYWSGARPEGSKPAQDTELFKRLADHVTALETTSRRMGIPLALEPEPGFLVESMADFDRLVQLVGVSLGLTLDIGHLVCVEDKPPQHYIEQYAGVLRNVQLDDMKPNAHRHLPFGEGDVDWPPVFNALARIGWRGPACVELSEASRDAVRVARESMAFIKKHAATPV